MASRFKVMIASDAESVAALSSSAATARSTTLVDARAIHQHTVCLLIFSLRPANPIQFAAFEQRRRSGDVGVVSLKRMTTTTTHSFCLIYCVCLRSPRTSVLSRVDRRRPGLRGHPRHSDRPTGHSLPLWLSRHPLFHRVRRLSQSGRRGHVIRQ